MLPSIYAPELLSAAQLSRKKDDTTQLSLSAAKAVGLIEGELLKLEARLYVVLGHSSSNILCLK